MHKIITICFAVLAFYGVSCAQDFSSNKPEKVTVETAAKVLPLKEELVYSVEWLGLPVGTIVIKMDGFEDIRGHKCYHVNARAFPNSFMKHIYDVEYKVNTYIDTNSLFSRRFGKARRINNAINYVLIDFYQEKGEAIFVSEGSNVNFKISPSRDELEKVKLPTNKIIYGTQDLLSALYYFRFQEIKEGAKYSVNIYYNQRNWNMSFSVNKPFKKEMRKLGTLDVVEISPDAELNDYILGKRKFSVYFTTDSRRIPVMFTLSTALGPMRGIIQNLPEKNG